MIEDVAARLRRNTAQVPGMKTFFSPVQNINIGGRRSNSQYQYTLQAATLPTLMAAIPDLEARMSRLPQIQDVSSDLEVTNPQLKIRVDEDRAAAIGVRADQIRSALYDAFGTRQVGTIYNNTDDYAIILELGRSSRTTRRSWAGYS